MFLGSGFLGLPLFFRGLAISGTVMLVAWSLNFAALFAVGTSADILDWPLTIVIVALCVYFGFKGNALIAKRYFSLGYEFVDPDGVEARVAAQSWGL